MPPQVLDLVARTVDQSSGPLNNIRQAVEQLGRAGVDLNKNQAAITKFGETMVRLGRSTRDLEQSQKHLGA
jgi:hypothetical protein